MPTISIITPWSGHTGPALLPEYFNAVQGAEIITVNNACADGTTQMLDQMHEQLGGQHIKNAENAGFAAGNNQGYALATGDIVVFLNSDIAGDARFLRAVAVDVKDGALYGPSLQQQLVAGRWLPYVEGWCIAATRATWERLLFPEDHTQGGDFIERYGPWDEYAYPDPYWEDNDLCLRALQAGLSLTQTAWPIQHKGGRTAGPIAAHGDSIERNRATFTRRVQAALVNRRDTPTPSYPRYMQQVFTQSDIQHHLPLLYSLARGNVLELGTRSGVSTTALLAGVEARGGHVYSVDTDPNSAKVAEGHPQWMFINGSSTDPVVRDRAMTGGVGQGPVVPIDMMLIDTEHNVSQVSAELALWEPFVVVGGTICVHDPETFPGVRRAIDDYCKGRSDLSVTYVLPCNGMAVIEKGAR